jgi:transposase
MVRAILKRDPLSGHAFLFFNRKRNYVKVLWWDESGYCIHAKRLAKGSFSRVEKNEISVSTLQQLLWAVELKSIRSRAKYEYNCND